MNSSMRLRNSGWKCLRTRSITSSRTSAHMNRFVGWQAQA
jgi:hypothetical protein